MSGINLRLEETFFHKFDCKHLDELPSSAGRHYHFPEGTKDGGRDGLLVQVFPHSSESWIGTFAFGNLAPKSKSGLYTWPDPERLCVVARGQGYLVRVDEPTNYEIIGVDPILDVVPVAARDLVVFANYTELSAYGGSGPVWATDRLSWDGIKLTRVTTEYIEGEVWDPRVEANVGFKVSLSNGHCEGGS